jgi:hypothetical protein
MAIEDNTRWPSPSVTSVPEYQLSGIPYCETITGGSANELEFTELPRVSRWISISAVGADVTVYFKSGNDSDNNQYFVVPSGTISDRLELRCTKVYFKQAAGVGNSASLVAGLTHIDKSKTLPESMLDWI